VGCHYRSVYARWQLRSERELSAELRWKSEVHGGDRRGERSTDCRGEFPCRVVFRLPRCRRCKILWTSRSRWGRPDGEHVVVVRLQRAEEWLAVVHAGTSSGTDVDDEGEASPTPPGGGRGVRRACLVASGTGHRSERERPARQPRAAR
jgi:hypothetical protein